MQTVTHHDTTACAWFECTDPAAALVLETLPEGTLLPLRPLCLDHVALTLDQNLTDSARVDIYPFPETR